MHVYNYIMSTSQLSLPHEQTVTSKGCGLIAFFNNDFAIDLGIDFGTAKFDQITFSRFWLFNNALPSEKKVGRDLEIKAKKMCYLARLITDAHGYLLTRGDT